MWWIGTLSKRITKLRSKPERRCGHFPPARVFEGRLSAFFHGEGRPHVPIVCSNAHAFGYVLLPSRSRERPAWRKVWASVPLAFGDGQLNRILQDFQDGFGFHSAIRGSLGSSNAHAFGYVLLPSRSRERLAWRKVRTSVPLVPENLFWSPSGCPSKRGQPPLWRGSVSSAPFFPDCAGWFGFRQEGSLPPRSDHVTAWPTPEKWDMQDDVPPEQKLLNLDRKRRDVLRQSVRQRRPITQRRQVAERLPSGR